MMIKKRQRQHRGLRSQKHEWDKNYGPYSPTYLTGPAIARLWLSYFLQSGLFGQQDTPVFSAHIHLAQLAGAGVGQGFHHHDAVGQPPFGHALL